jgi:hypothetical protein
MPNLFYPPRGAVFLNKEKGIRTFAVTNGAIVP